MKIKTKIPGNERWLHTPEVSEMLDRALAWAKKNPPRETDLDELEARIFAGVKDSTSEPPP